jgi:glycosyltransferase involved in cell wall biosynthesis
MRQIEKTYIDSQPSGTIPFHTAGAFGKQGVKLKPLKILIFNWRCWQNPAMGGAEIFTHEIAKRWVQAGHQVILCTSTFPSCQTKEISDGVKIVRVGGGRYSFYKKAKKFFETTFREENYDVVVDEINTRPFFAPQFAKNCKVVALIHQLAKEYWFYEVTPPVSWAGYYFLEKHWLSKYRDVLTVTVSESTYNDLAGLGFRNVVIVPEGLNFTPVDKLPEKVGPPVIVYSGRLTKAKRPEHALEAFKLVKQKVPEAELVFLGDGPLMPKLREKAVEGVKFCSKLSNAERRGELEKGWVLVNPSVREGWGLNVIEANALGIPCVVYDVPGLRDSVKNGVTGLLAQSGNISQLAQQITGLLLDVEKRQLLAGAALEYSKSFSWDKTASAFLEIFQKT